MHYGIGHMVRGEVVWSLGKGEVVKGQPPPLIRVRGQPSPPVKRSTTSPQGQRSTTTPNRVRGQPPPPGSEVNHLPTPGSEVNHLPPGYIIELRSMGGWYTSYWNAYLFIKMCSL